MPHERSQHGKKYRVSAWNAWGLSTCQVQREAIFQVPACWRTSSGLNARSCHKLHCRPHHSITPENACASLPSFFFFSCPLYSPYKGSFVPGGPWLLGKAKRTGQRERQPNLVRFLIQMLILVSFSRKIVEDKHGSSWRSGWLCFPVQGSGLWMGWHTWMLSILPEKNVGTWKKKRQKGNRNAWLKTGGEKPADRRTLRNDVSQRGEKAHSQRQEREARVESTCRCLKL